MSKQSIPKRVTLNGSETYAVVGLENSGSRGRELKLAKVNASGEIDRHDNGSPKVSRMCPYPIGAYNYAAITASGSRITYEYGELADDPA